MEEIRNERFEGTPVVLDGRTFSKCHLVNCELFYSGGPFVFSETTLIGCTWSFGGAARRTLSLLQTFEIGTNGANYGDGRAELSWFAGPLQ